MKTEFDLNNLTDANVEFLEEALSRRRFMKLHLPEFDIDCNINWVNAAIDNALYTNAIHGMVAPNYRQLGMNLENDIFRTSEFIKKAIQELKWDYRELAQDQIDEEHEQYNAIFNQFRRSKYLPSIELKIGNLYELKLGSREVHTKEMYLVRIDGNINHSPELYFSSNIESSSGTNISVYKILKEIK